MPGRVITYIKLEDELDSGAFHVAAPVGTLPDVVVWVPACQVHKIVSPTSALVVKGEKPVLPMVIVCVVAFAVKHKERRNIKTHERPEAMNV